MKYTELLFFTIISVSPTRVTFCIGLFHTMRVNVHAHEACMGGPPEVYRVWPFRHRSLNSPLDRDLIRLVVVVEQRIYCVQRPQLTGLWPPRVKLPRPVIRRSLSPDRMTQAVAVNPGVVSQNSLSVVLVQRRFEVSSTAARWRWCRRSVSRWSHAVQCRASHDAALSLSLSLSLSQPSPRSRNLICSAARHFVKMPPPRCLGPQRAWMWWWQSDMTRVMSPSEPARPCTSTTDSEPLWPLAADVWVGLQQLGLLQQRRRFAFTRCALDYRPRSPIF